MSQVVHYVKQYWAERTTTSSTLVELTDYTIAWSALTGAGLAAGDDVIIIVQVHIGSASVNSNARFAVEFRSSYSGFVADHDTLSYASMEPYSNTSAHKMQYLWLDRRTLVSNENIYFSGNISTGTARFENFSCIILKLGDLSSNDWLYAENSAANGNAPTSYDTNGASVTTAASGDWLFFGCTHWLIDSNSADLFQAIQVDGVDKAECSREGEDNVDEMCMGAMVYANLASSKTVRVRYRVDSATSHDCNRSAIFGLRLGAFKDSVAASTDPNFAPSASNQSTSAWAPSFSLSQAGNVLAFGCGVYYLSSASDSINTYLEEGGVKWPDSTAYAAEDTDNLAGSDRTPIAIGYGSRTSGSRSFNFYVRVGNLVGAPTCDEFYGGIFSLEKAPTGATYNESVSESGGTASDSTTAAHTLVGAVSEGGGTASNSATSVLTAVGAVSENGGAGQDSFAGVATKASDVSESGGNAAETFSGGLIFASDVSEAGGTASDAASAFLSLPAAISEAGGTAQEVMDGVSAKGSAISESGNAAQEAVDGVATKASAVSEAGGTAQEATDATALKASAVSEGGGTAQDSLEGLVPLNVSIAESGGSAGESASAVTAAVGAISESGGSAQESTVSVLEVVASVSESGGTAGDATTGGFAAIGAVDEAGGTASDSVNGERITEGAVAELSPASDAVSAVTTMVGAVSETDALADAVDGSSVKASAVSESGGTASEALAGGLALDSAVTDSGGTAQESVSGQRITEGAVSESDALLDTVSAAAIKASAVSESDAAQDAVSGVSVKASAIAETDAATDTISGSVDKFGDIAESMTTADAVSALMTISASYTEAEALLDVVDGVASMIAAVAESFTISDAYFSQSPFMNLAADLWLPQESAVYFPAQPQTALPPEPTIVRNVK